jgi:hypothetical protein
MMGKVALEVRLQMSEAAIDLARIQGVATEIMSHFTEERLSLERALREVAATDVADSDEEAKAREVANIGVIGVPELANTAAAADGVASGVDVAQESPETHTPRGGVSTVVKSFGLVCGITPGMFASQPPIRKSATAQRFR